MNNNHTCLQFKQLNQTNQNTTTQKQKQMFRQDNNGVYILQLPIDDNKKHKYIRKRLLGKGGFAKCYEIEQEQSGEKFACKIIDKQTSEYKKTKDKVQSEMAIHKKLVHGNIVRFQKYYQNEHYIYILLQLCNTTLDKLMQRRKNLHQVEVRYFLYQIIQAIAYLHQQKVIHRDLKLENFLLSEDMEVKIGDFGLAAYYNMHHKRKSVCGTFNYMAPEIFTAKDGYSIQVDIWSLGITAFIMLTGKFPFENNDVKKISRQINNKTYFYKTNISQISKDLVSNMLQLNPIDRLAVKQLLKHDFFIKFEIPKVLPLSCLVCYPAYKAEIKASNKQENEDDQFRFMLESKESPLTPKIQKIELPYYQHISSQKHEKEINFKIEKKICSFQYDSKRNNSCNIKKWITQIEEFPKHGLLYRVNDGAICFRFNDGSNMKVCDKLKTKFLYISQKQRQKFIDIKQSEQLSSELSIKMKVFMEYLQKMVLEDDYEVQETISIRLYYNCVDIFLIWLNNGMMQGKFQDESELIMDIDSCMYIDEFKIKTLFPSTKLNDQDPKILKKKEILSSTVRRHAILKQKYFPPKNKENNFSNNL